MDATPRWALPMLFAGQASKEIFHNEALWQIDALIHAAVLSADVSVPPGSPAIGACWIVTGGATGAWSGHAGAIACWSEGGWRFIAPRAGLSVLVVDRGHAMRHDGTSWSDAPLRADGLYHGTDRVVSARQAAIAAPSGGSTVDSQSRTALSAILSALRAHGLISI